MIPTKLEMLDINISIETIQKSAITNRENFEKGVGSKRVEEALGVLWLRDTARP